jgi:hypothetical protein
MDLFAKLKDALRGDTSSKLPVERWACDMVVTFEREAVAAGLRSPNLDQLPTARAIVKRERVDRPELVAAIIQRLKEMYDEVTGKGAAHYYTDFWMRGQALKALINALLRVKLPFSEDRLAAVLDFCAANVAAFRHMVPYGLLIRQVDYAAGGTSVQGALAEAATRFANAMRSPGGAGEKMLAVVERMLAGQGTDAVLLPSPWFERVRAESEGESAQRIIAHALTAAGKAKPTQAFLKSSRTLMAQQDELAAQAMAWLEAYVPDPQHPDPNEDTMRGLLWMLAFSSAEAMASRLGQYCELCFKKIPNVGARSVKLGNGAIQALGIMGGSHAVAELTRLKTRVRYPLAVRKVEAALVELASQLNVSDEELEEIALPAYDLSRDGERRVPIGEGAAIIRVAGTREVVLSFVRSDGREVSSVPQELKDGASTALAAVRKLRKEIENTLAGQAARIERLYLSDRTLPFGRWRERYLEHPLAAALTRRLIWKFETPAAALVGLPRAGTIEDVDGKPLAVASDAVVRLWHPLNETADHVLAWRRRLAALGLTQPFKQAHREIYLLTDAERQTEIYSNRFAAHLLRQHQCKALCDQRGWRYHLMGDWDSHNTPVRTLSGRGLSVEYWVNGVDADIAGSGVYTLIATDQVRFTGPDGGPIPLANVPPLVFSELMRDVDLFVGVASVGNDPEWADGGPDGRFHGYWAAYAFGDLSQSARTRAEVLATLLPSLVIADRCELGDRFLRVRGNLRTYKIHLGSTNIQMEPNDQYLCIVPGRGSQPGVKSVDPLVLPFEGDRALSIILSKAFMLAADDKITDPTILRQIRPA